MYSHWIALEGCHRVRKNRKGRKNRKDRKEGVLARAGSVEKILMFDDREARK